MIFGATQPFDRNLINESPLDSDAAKDLKSTLKMLYEKVYYRDIYVITIF